MKIHEKYISRCIELAKNGLGSTYPNPLVGSVVVYEDCILGEGWHTKQGEAHAEVLAIKGVAARKFLEKATLYVSLEPCSHYGKTPPCADFILHTGIKKVVIGTPDPYPAVAGKGITKLIEGGCEVIVGVLEDSCKELNRRFFTYHLKKRPFVILKWAESQDGYMVSATHKNRVASGAAPAKPEWLSNVYCRQLVHKWRTEEQAVLVGGKTVWYDNPSLTARDWVGANPVRVVVSRQGVFPKDCAIQDGSAPTIFISDKKVFMDSGNTGSYEFIDFTKDVAHQIVQVLYNRGLQSIIIEGGAQMLHTFIEEGLWDEARVFTGTRFLMEGDTAPVVVAKPAVERKIYDTVLRIYQRYD